MSADAADGPGRAAGDFRQRARDEMIASYVGPSATWRPYDRTLRTPMNLVLDVIEREAGIRAEVVWVESGPPELFCLPGFDPMLVIFGTSFLSTSATIRDLLTLPLQGHELQASVAEAALLGLIANLSLRHGDPDVAALAFARSVSTETIVLPDNEERWRALEHEPIGEAYMLLWFGGLAHEMGHHPAWLERAQGFPRLSDERIAELFELAMEHDAQGHPKPVRERMRAAFADPTSGSALSLTQLRAELAADTFAFITMWLATQEIMAKGGRRMNAVAFVAEFLAFFLGTLMTEGCGRVARWAKESEPEWETVFEGGIAQPLAMRCRLYQAQALCLDPTLYRQVGVDFSLTEPALMETTGHLMARFRAADSGYARAVRFCLYHHERTSEPDILEAARAEALEIPASRRRLERFCALARDLRRSSKVLTALDTIARDPSTSLGPE